MTTAIVNVRLFDGKAILPHATVVIAGHTIAGINIPIPAGATLIDGLGHTLLPGLIDAHVHTSKDSLRLALRFGITTELDLANHWDSATRSAIADDDTVADLRCADHALTAPGGHPNQVIQRVSEHIASTTSVETTHDSASYRAHPHDIPLLPSVTSPEEAVAFVADRVTSGADYIKFMIEEGTLSGQPGLPLMLPETIAAGVKAAHSHGKLAIAHAMTRVSTAQALQAGMDGLTHLFLDGPLTPDLLRLFQQRNAFITPCACLNASFLGLRPAILDDSRVTGRLPPEWLDTLAGSFDCYQEGKMDDVFSSIKDLHAAGIDILAGTDASLPFPVIGGIAHGASVHHELQLFVAAGMSPSAALQAATEVPTRRYGLHDRGRIAEGLRADLLLVEGDPLTNIQDTLNIRSVWRRGAKVDLEVPLGSSHAV